MTATQGLTLQFVGLIILASIWVYFKAINELRRYQAYPQGHEPAQVPQERSQRTEPAQMPIQAEVLGGAGRAMANPPQDLRLAIRYVQHEYPDLQYPAPLGWHVYPTGEAVCVGVGFVDDTYHMLITGMSRAGKDNMALGMMFALARQYRPEQLQFCIIDGKGLDFAGWEGKAHTWCLALDPTEIAPAMKALSEERQRRAKILRAAGVSKWESYQGGDLPLLIVYISELSLLQDATSKTGLATWMNSELAAGAAFGLRYIVATQTASNFDTRWRSQIGLYVAAFQPRDDQDEANTGLTTKQIKAAGAVAPSELPPPPAGAGVFTVVSGRQCQTLRSGYLTDDQRAAWLACLPAAPVSAPIAEGTPMSAVLGHSDAQELEALLFSENREQPEDLAVETTPVPTPVSNEQEQGTSSTPVVEVPEEERVAILTLAKTGMSRRKIAQQIYGGMGKYDRVRTVLDAVEPQPSQITTTA